MTETPTSFESGYLAGTQLVALTIMLKVPRKIDKRMFEIQFFYSKRYH